GPALLGEQLKEVNVPAFYIDETEVSNAQYIAFCDARNRPRPQGVEGQPLANPVVNVSWDDAEAYAQWAGKRLPTASEWEKAARGTKGQKFPWGTSFQPDKANLGIANEKNTIAVADAFAGGKSPYGAYNMLGNVWEWLGTSEQPDNTQFE